MKSSRQLFRERRGLGIMVALLCLCHGAHAQPEEEVSFFTQNNGMGGFGSAIWGFEKNTWRWWFNNVEAARLSPNSREVAYVFSSNGTGLRWIRPEIRK